MGVRRYTDADRDLAIARLRKGKSGYAIAQELQIPTGVIYRWRNEEAAQSNGQNGNEEAARSNGHSNGKNSSPDHEDELASLRAEVIELRREKEFLERVVCFFARQRDQGNGG